MENLLYTARLVRDFQNAFGHPVADKPTIPEKKRAALRTSLIAEELEELREAIRNDDIVEVLDAFCDLEYVLQGAILEFGMQGLFLEAFANVHHSNMSKLCSTEEEAKETIEWYAKRGTETYYELATEDKYAVYRKSDNKILKSIKYTPADMNQFFANSD